MGQFSIYKWERERSRVRGSRKYHCCDANHHYALTNVFTKMDTAHWAKKHGAWGTNCSRTIDPCAFFLARIREFKKILLICLRLHQYEEVFIGFFVSLQTSSSALHTSWRTHVLFRINRDQGQRVRVRVRLRIREFEGQVRNAVWKEKKGIFFNILKWESIIGSVMRISQMIIICVRKCLKMGAGCHWRICVPFLNLFFFF